jgi:transposase
MGTAALHVTAAGADDRAEVGRLAQAVQASTGQSVDLAYVDQGYTGQKAADAAKAHGIELEVVKLPEAKRGFVLLPRRWVVERSLAWATRFRRLVKGYEGYARRRYARGRSASERGETIGRGNDSSKEQPRTGEISPWRRHHVTRTSPRRAAARPPEPGAEKRRPSGPHAPALRGLEPHPSAPRLPTLPRVGVAPRR